MKRPYRFPLPDQTFRFDLSKLDNPDPDVHWVMYDQLTNELVYQKGYAWDGETGGIEDSESVIPSLIHDGLYQMMDVGSMLPTADNKKFADLLFYDLLRKYGMDYFEAKLHYYAVRRFGGRRFNK